jgi:hypothetical protein
MASLRASATAFLKRFSISVIALFLVVVWTSPLGSGAAADDEPLGVGNHTEFMAATYRTEISGRDASIYILIDSQKSFLKLFRCFKRWAKSTRPLRQQM